MLVTAWAFPVVMGATYLALIVIGLADSSAPGLAGFSSLEGVRTLFSRDGFLLAGWLHYLAFDLFVGSWEVRDASREAVPHLLVVPCLVLTFLLGPVGLLLYLAVRAVRLRRVSITKE
jgi:hypothetical protein